MATVSGYVEKIKYRNEENGYSILSVNSDGLDYVLVGTFPYISEGDFIEASGRDVEHPIYGDQIQVESYELKAPEDTASMERYLGYPTYLRRLALRHISSMYKMVFHFHLLDPVHLDLL